MSNEEIFGIIDYLNSLSFSEFELETGDLKIRIKRENSSFKNAANHIEEVTKETPPEKTEQEYNMPCMLAPITGVYYKAPSPDEKPYVKVGDKVKEGDVLCILEAMKNMIEVKSEISGKIAQILGKDGEPVEEGETLFVFEEE